MPILSRALATTRKSLAMFLSVVLVATILVTFDSIVGEAESAAAAAARPTLITLTVNRPVLLAGQTATLTARTDVSVQASASTITIVDQTTGTILKTCTTGKACSATSTLTSGGPHTFVATVNELSSGTVTVERAAWSLSLVAAASTVIAGGVTRLTATANQNLGNTGGTYRTLIYDDTTGTLLVSCETGKTCSVNTTPFYTGDGHSYSAVVAAGDVDGELVDVQAQSNQVAVSRRDWTVALTANRTQFTAGQTATLTATANQSAANTGGAYEISIFDVTAGVRVKSCATGKTCSVAQSFTSGGPHEYVAAVAAVGNAQELGDVSDLQAASNQISVSRAAWSLTAVKVAGTLTAAQDLKFKITANQNLTNTAGSYVIYWFDAVTGQKLGTCATGTNCTVIALKNGTPGGHAYFAVVAAPTNPATFAAAQDVQAISNTVAASGYWSVSLASDSTEFEAGSFSTLTATASHDIDSTGEPLAIILFDLTTGLPVGTCEAGTSCTVQVAFASGAPHHYRAVLATSTNPADYASVVGTLAASSEIVIARAPWTVSLEASTTVFSAGEVVTFTAEANQNVGETFASYRIYVFDQTTGDRVGQCGIGATCVIESSELFFTGGSHQYTAVVAESGVLDLAHLADVQATSEPVTLTRTSWTVSLTTSTETFAVGQPVTLTATTGQDVGATGGAYQIQILDLTTHTAVATCTEGEVCSADFSALFRSGGPHSYVAVVAARDSDFSSSGLIDVQATSEHVAVARQAWTLALEATDTQRSSDPDPIVTTTLSVETNQYVTDLGSDYSVVLLDRTSGDVLVAELCPLVCEFTVSQPANVTPHAYVAYIAQYDATSSPSYFDVQVESNGISADTGGGDLVVTPLPEPFLGFGSETGWDAERPILYWLDPEFSVQAFDPTDPETGAMVDPVRDYSFDLELRVEGGFGPISTTTVVGARLTRDEALQITTANWHLPEGLLEDGGRYELRARTVWPDAFPAPQATGEWGDWSGFSVVVGPRTPVDLLPANDSQFVGDEPIVLSAVEEEYDASPVITGIFRIEDADLQIEVQSGLGLPADEDGVLRYDATGLLPGVYRWQVKATDDVSHSRWSEFHTFTYDRVPDATTYTGVAPRRSGIGVSWAPVEALGPAKVLDYTVTVNPGAHTVVVPPDRYNAVIGGLSPGAYTVSVAARNALGFGAPGPVKSVTVSPTTSLPPANVTTELDGSTATVRWEAPADSGGTPVIDYEVRVYSNQGEILFMQNTTDLAIQVTDLQFGEYHSIYVIANNAVGQSEWAYTSVCPFTVPDAVGDVRVLPGDGELELRWNELEYNPCADVTRYTVTVSPGGQRVDVSPSPSGINAAIVENLDNGTEYTFVVTATNPAGEGAPSASTSPTTPVAGSTDSDGDGLPDNVEIRAGSDPLLIDTDFDGLGDRVEVLELGGILSFTSSDTDGDEISDAAEDTDEDSLDNLAEITAGLNPLNPDTDGDGISDGAEGALGLDPILLDGDGDGLGDGDEVALGLDPTLADSDGNGSPDGEATVSTVLTSDDVSAEIEGGAADLVETQLNAIELTRVPGLLTQGASVELAETEPDGASAVSATATSSLAAQEVTVVGPPPTVTSLTFSLSTLAVLEELDSLAPVRWNESTGTWEFVDKNVSVSTARRTLTIFSPDLGVKYAIVDLRSWRANARQCDKTVAPRLDLEVVFDGTASVGAADPTGERFRATKTALGRLLPGDNVFVRQFGFVFIGSANTAEAWVFYPDGDSSGFFPTNSASYRRGGLHDSHASAIQNGKAEVDYLAAHADTSYPEGFGDLPGYEPALAEIALSGAYSPSVQRPFTSATANPYLTGGQARPASQCRVQAMLLITDGETQLPDISDAGNPGWDYDPGYVPFTSRTDVPVHILDVGAGGDSSGWLIDLAERTGGTYSYVPTMTDLQSWVRDVTPAPPIPVVLDAVDSDGDGLSDWVETHGVTPSMDRLDHWDSNLGDDLSQVFASKIFYSNPHDADTDNDGLPDGVELGSPLSSGVLGGWDSNQPVTVYSVASNPSSVDSDIDGYPDVEEVQVRLNALNFDTDGDGMKDGDEAVWGTNPWRTDTDGDGVSDRRDVQGGHDPHIKDREMTTLFEVLDHVNSLFLGFICGDNSACFADDIWWVAGALVAGLLIFGDVRDYIIQFFFDNNYEAAAVTATWFLVGIIPWGGLGAKIVGKVARLATRVGERTHALLVDLLIKWGEESYAIFLLMSRHQTLADRLSNLAGSLGQSAILASIKNIVAGPHPETLTSVERAVQTIRCLPLPNYVTRPGWFGSWALADSFIQRQYGRPAGTTYVRTALRVDTSKPLSRSNYRVYDYLQYVGGSTVPIAHEVKIGYVNSASSINDEIVADRRLIASGRVDTVIWHFMMSAESGSLGPDSGVLKQLTDNGIDYMIHLPAGALD